METCQQPGHVACGESVIFDFVYSVCGAAYRIVDDDHTKRARAYCERLDGQFKFDMCNVAPCLSGRRPILKKFMQIPKGPMELLNKCADHICGDVRMSNDGKVQILKDIEKLDE